MTYRACKTACLGLLLLAAVMGTNAQGVTSNMGSLMQLCSSMDPVNGDIFYCAVENSIPINDVHVYTFTVAPNSDFNLVLQLRSMSGDADM